MNQNLIDYLLSKKDNATTDSTRLRMLGDKAADKYLLDGVPLNEAVTAIAKEASLNYEQIKRVCEFANNRTFAEKFKQPYDKNISYPLAESIKVAAACTQLPTEASKEKTASAVISRGVYFPGRETADRAVLPPMVKTAAPYRTSVAGAVRELRGETDVLNDLKHTLSATESKFQHKLAMLARVTHRELAAGEVPETVGAAVLAARPSQELMRVVADELGSSMRLPSLSKLAQQGYEVDASNEITGLITDLEAITQKLLATDELVSNAKAAIDALTEFLRGPTPNNPTNDLFAENNADSLDGQQAAQPAGMPPPPQPMGAPVQ